MTESCRSTVGYNAISLFFVINADDEHSIICRAEVSGSIAIAITKSAGKVSISSLPR